MPTTPTKVLIRFPDDTEYTLTLKIETVHLALARAAVESIVKASSGVIEFNELLRMFNRRR